MLPILPALLSSDLHISCVAHPPQTFHTLSHFNLFGLSLFQKQLCMFFYEVSMTCHSVHSNVRGKQLCMFFCEISMDMPQCTPERQRTTCRIPVFCFYFMVSVNQTQVVYLGACAASTVFWLARVLFFYSKVTEWKS